MANCEQSEAKNTVSSHGSRCVEYTQFFSDPQNSLTFTFVNDSKFENSKDRPKLARIVALHGLFIRGEAILVSPSSFLFPSRPRVRAAATREHLTRNARPDRVWNRLRENRFVSGYSPLDTSE